MIQLPQERCGLAVRSPIKLMGVLLDTFHGNAFLSLEGDLSQCDLRGLAIVDTQPRVNLRRNTGTSSHPRLDFIIIAVDAGSVPIMKRLVLPKVGLRKRVIHVQIEQDGVLVFGAYDQFDKESVWVSADIGIERLNGLKEAGAIWDYQLLPTQHAEEA